MANVPFPVPSPKFHLIKQGHKCLGLQHCNASYVVGFKNPLLARKVHYTLHPEADKRIRLERSVTFDVTDDVTDGLGSLGINYVGQKVTIDTQALLHLPKHGAGGVLDPMNDVGFHLDIVEACNFYMYPFERNLGVIMPYELLEESADELVMWSHVIDPTIDPLAVIRALSLG